MDVALLEKTAREMTIKTILAADESSGTIAKRFATIGLDSTPENNRIYRQLLLGTPDIEAYVSGVILFDETIRQKTDEGVPFPDSLSKRGIAPGIKVDQGVTKFGEGGVDTVTNGLDGLPERLLEYRKLGARFAKWRSVFTIMGDLPSNEVIEKNTSDLAAYAKFCQDSGIVPIVEPEVLMEGAHPIEKTREVTQVILARLFAKLREAGVILNGVILKPNMITPGAQSPVKASVDEVAVATIATLLAAVPLEVPGIAFLSGGQSPELATEHLNAINKIKNADPGKYPWRITASYGRALQGEALEAWSGKSENLKKAQDIFIQRAKKVFKASLGNL